MRREAVMAPANKTFQVTIRNSGQTIACAADRTILQAAIAAGIDYPYACATGNCATCVSKLEEGKCRSAAGDAPWKGAGESGRRCLSCSAAQRRAINWLD